MRGPGTEVALVENDVEWSVSGEEGAWMHRSIQPVPQGSSPRNPTATVAAQIENARRTDGKLMQKTRSHPSPSRSS